jgi:hypothetical protein
MGGLLAFLSLEGSLEGLESINSWVQLGLQLGAACWLALAGLLHPASDNAPSDSSENGSRSCPFLSKTHRSCLAKLALGTAQLQLCLGIAGHPYHWVLHGSFADAADVPANVCLPVPGIIF